MKNILITGSSGFIGKHLVERLSRLTDVNLSCFDIDTFPLKWYRNTKYDFVIHGAALVEARESVKEPLRYYDNNIGITLEVLNTIDFDKIIYLDSEMSLRPDNPYASSKAMCNKIIMDTTGGDYYRVVLSNVLGANHDSKTHILPSLLRGTFKLHNEGKDIRSYVDMKTVVLAIENIILNPIQNKYLYLTDFKDISTLEFVDTYNKTLNGEIITDNKLAKLGVVLKRIMKHEKL